MTNEQKQSKKSFEGKDFLIYLEDEAGETHIRGWYRDMPLYADIRIGKKYLDEMMREELSHEEAEGIAKGIYKDRIIRVLEDMPFTGDMLQAMDEGGMKSLLYYHNGYVFQRGSAKCVMTGDLDVLSTMIIALGSLSVIRKEKEAKAPMTGEPEYEFNTRTLYLKFSPIVGSRNIWVEMRYKNVYCKPFVLASTGRKWIELYHSVCKSPTSQKRAANTRYFVMTLMMDMLEKRLLPRLLDGESIFLDNKVNGKSYTLIKSDGGYTVLEDVKDGKKNVFTGVWDDMLMFVLNVSSIYL